MGCNNSRHVLEMESRPVRPVTLSSHSAGSAMTSSTMFQDYPGLRRQQIIDAFQKIAEYLNEYGVSIDCVAVDGAVNTLYLRSRESTHDVELLLNDPSSKESILLTNAASFANSQAQGRLGETWLNSSMQLFLPRNVQTSLVQEAKTQNEIVFEHQGTNGGLRVYAAPWSFALCSKLNHAFDHHNRTEDMDDAVDYLYRYLNITGQDYIMAQQIKDWCQTYHQDVSREVLRRLEETYARKHGNWPIVWN
ncbi:hypothetical protein SNK03_003760 [Fusarium graminearum]|uniref:DUF7582 domain-containing protein n=1 Tax=Gibberella zeae TaxID=5518 RepID=A0A2H3FF92_GIBZA|nr:hypothetical protein HG531_014081 [Fusarium graminearum]PCD18661.1 hypothetical protein FGRA07_06414 [Fusarium graminearum]CAF3519477.1 unnamed protein product [Fusarium graminearum]CAF3559481.1 unnamed protein product [Fusarium graminearum]CAF3613536.1 unnamed protein product [Fusarium graminearum]